MFKIGFLFVGLVVEYVGFWFAISFFWLPQRECMRSPGYYRRVDEFECSTVIR